MLENFIMNLSLATRAALFGILGMLAWGLMFLRLLSLAFIGELDSLEAFFWLLIVGVCYIGISVWLYSKLLLEKNMKQFVNSKDFVTIAIVCVAYYAIMQIKYDLGDLFYREYLFLSMLVVSFALQLNRLGPLLSVIIMDSVSVAFAWGLPLESAFFVCSYVLLQQFVIWCMGLGVLIESRAREEAQHTAAKLEATQELLEQTIQYNERLKIGRDIHDRMGHSLAALNIHLQICEKMAPEEMKEHLQSCRDASSHLFDELRETVYELRKASRIDLVGSVNTLIDGLPNIRVDYSYDGNIDAIDHEQADCLLHCIKEAMTNVLKHSSATSMDIRMSVKEQHVDLRISDNGGLASPMLHEGSGLRGMRERVAAIRGRVSFLIEKGMKIDVRLPLPENNNNESLAGDMAL